MAEKERSLKSININSEKTQINSTSTNLSVKLPGNGKDEKQGKEKQQDSINAILIGALNEAIYGKNIGSMTADAAAKSLKQSKQQTSIFDVITGINNSLGDNFSEIIDGLQADTNIIAQACDTKSNVIKVNVVNPELSVLTGIVKPINDIEEILTNKSKPTVEQQAVKDNKETINIACDDTMKEMLKTIKDINGKINEGNKNENGATVTNAVTGVINSLLGISKLSAKQRINIATSINFINTVIIDKLKETGEKISELSDDFDSKKAAQVEQIIKVVTQITHIGAPLAAYALLAPVAIVGAVGAGVTIKVLSKILTNVDADKIKGSLEGLRDFSTAVALMSGTLLAGALLMKIIDVKNALKFTLVMGAFVGAMMTIFVISSKFVGNAIKGAEEFGVLVAISAGTLIIGGLFMYLPGMAKNIIAFGLLLAGFIGIVTTAYTIFNGKNAALALQGAGALAVLIGVTSATLLIGGMFMYIPGMWQNVLLFGGLVAAFVAMIGIALLPLTLGSFKLLSTGPVIAFSILVGVIGGLLLKAGSMIANNPAIGGYALAFAAISAAYIGAMVYLLTVLNGIPAATLKNGMLTLGSIVLLTAGMGAVAYEIFEIVKGRTLDDFIKAAAVLGGMFGVIAGLLAGALLIGSKRNFIRIKAGLMNIAIATAIVGEMGIAIFAINKAVGDATWEKLKEMGATIAGMFAAVAGILVGAGVLGSLMSGPQALAIGAGELAIAGAVAIVGEMAFVVSMISKAVDDIQKIKDLNYDNITKPIEAFVGIADTLLKNTPILMLAGATAIPATLALAASIATISFAMKSIAELKIPTGYDSKGNPTGYVAISDKTFNTVSENVEQLVTCLARGLVNGINGHPEYFSEGLLGIVDSPAMNAAKVVGELGRSLIPIATGIEALSELRVPISFDQNGKPKEFITLGKETFSTVSTNVENLITSVAQGLVNGISNKDLFGEGLFTDSPAMNAAKAVKEVSNALYPIAESLNLMQKLQFKDEKGNIISLGTDSFKTVTDNIGKIVTATASGLVNGISNKDLFGEGWISDSPAMNAAKAINKLGDPIYNIAQAINAMAQNEFVTYGANGKITSRIKVTEKDRKKAFDTLVGNGTKQNPGLVNLLATALITAVQGNPDLFNDGVFEDSPAMNAAKAISTLTNSISNTIDIINELAKTDTKTINARLATFNDAYRNIVNHLVKMINYIVGTPCAGNKDIYEIIKGSDSVADWINDKEGDIEDFNTALSNISGKDGFIGKLINICNQLGDEDFLKAYNTFKGKGNSLYEKVSAIVRNVVKSINYTTAENVKTSFDSYKKYQPELDNILTNYLSTIKNLTSVLDSINVAEETLKQKNIERVCSGIIYINDTITKLSAKGQNVFNQQTSSLNRYVKSINSVQVNNVNALSGLVSQLNTLSARMGNLDKLTDAIANALSVELQKLTNQLVVAERTIKEADKLQKRRHELIDRSVEKIKKIMAEKIMVEIKQDPPATVNTDSSLSSQDTSNGGGIISKVGNAIGDALGIGDKDNKHSVTSSKGKSSAPKFDDLGSKGNPLWVKIKR